MSMKDLATRDDRSSPDGEVEDVYEVASKIDAALRFETPDELMDVLERFTSVIIESELTDAKHGRARIANVGKELINNRLSLNVNR